MIGGRGGVGWMGLLNLCDIVGSRRLGRFDVYAPCAALVCVIYHLQFAVARR